jgi:hypothetical protein
MPSMSGGASRPRRQLRATSAHRFYALDVGRALRRVKLIAIIIGGLVSMPSMSGGALRHYRWRNADGSWVSMPSMSGGALRRQERLAGRLSVRVSMPSMSGGALRRQERLAGRLSVRVSMPSMSGGALRLRATPRSGRQPSCVSMPSMSGGALRRELGFGRSDQVHRVSMPSMSGGALRRMRSDGTSDLGIWCPFRQPPAAGDQRQRARRRRTGRQGLDLRRCMCANLGGNRLGALALYERLA